MTEGMIHVVPNADGSFGIAFTATGVGVADPAITCPDETELTYVLSALGVADDAIPQVVRARKARQSLPGRAPLATLVTLGLM